VYIGKGRGSLRLISDAASSCSWWWTDGL